MGAEKVSAVELDAEARHALLRALLAACDGDADALQSDEESLEVASHDWSFHTPRRPLIVVRPSTPEQVAATLAACAAARISVTPQGALTGVEGGAIALTGGVALSTKRLRRLHVREQEMLAVVGAGLYKNELNAELGKLGLLFGPDPSSNPSLGGMASTGGSGLSTLRYGTMKENVVSLLVATPQGHLIRTRREVRKSSAGYELTQLYLGSEGTLGVICELTVRVRKLPAYRAGGVLPFPDVLSAVQTVVAAIAADPPSLLRCELLNADGVRCTNAIYNTSLDVLPTLFLEFRGSDVTALKKDFETVFALARDHGCAAEKVRFAENGEDLDTLWEARRGCYFAAMKYRGKSSERVYVGDVCVPVPHLPRLVADSEAACHARGLECVICAHIADGNFHFLVPHQRDEQARVIDFQEEILGRALDLGGTVSGEHGVGIGKVHFCAREHGEAHIGVQQAIKAALDPLNIMNPGKVLPTEPSPKRPDARL